MLCLIIARDWVCLTRGPMAFPASRAAARIARLGELAIDRPAAFYGLMLVYAVVLVRWSIGLVRSRIGRAFAAIKLNQALAETRVSIPCAIDAGHRVPPAHRTPPGSSSSI